MIPEDQISKHLIYPRKDNLDLASSRKRIDKIEGKLIGEILNDKSRINLEYSLIPFEDTENYTEYPKSHGDDDFRMASIRKRPTFFFGPAKRAS